jgi:hypothetical protein
MAAPPTKSRPAGPAAKSYAQPNPMQAIPSSTLSTASAIHGRRREGASGHVARCARSDPSAPPENATNCPTPKFASQNSFAFAAEFSYERPFVRHLLPVRQAQGTERATVPNQARRRRV